MEFSPAGLVLDYRHLQLRRVGVFLASPLTCANSAPMCMHLLFLFADISRVGSYSVAAACSTAFLPVLCTERRKGRLSCHVASFSHRLELHLMLDRIVSHR